MIIYHSVFSFGRKMEFYYAIYYIMKYGKYVLLMLSMIFSIFSTVRFIIRKIKKKQYINNDFTYIKCLALQ